MAGWVEIGDRVFVRRYEFWDQNIGVVLGEDAALVIDTRMTPRQAEEIRTDLRELTAFPVEIVVDTHGHSDHAFGNSVFRPATIWAHVGCGLFLHRTGEEQRERQIRQFPDMADDLRAVVIDLPDRSFEEHVGLRVGGRPIELHYLGRGHTDHDIVVIVPGTGVIFAGDLLEGGAVPSFGDAFPLEWPATVEAMLPLIEDVVVPGHGDRAGRAFAEEQLESLRGLVELGRRVDAGGLTMDAALALTPYPAYPPDDLRAALERTLAQVRGAVT